MTSEPFFLTEMRADGTSRVRLDRLADGRIMCQLCFGYFRREELNPVGEGQVEDVCRQCATLEQERTTQKMDEVSAEAMDRLLGQLMTCLEAVRSTVIDLSHKGAIGPDVAGTLMRELTMVAEAVPFVADSEHTARQTQFGVMERNEAINTDGESEALNARIDDLKRWWRVKANQDIEMVAEKAVTYGSNSLTQLGRKMAQLNGRHVSDDEAQELGCWVYATGKLERWTDAVMRGERPKDDTLGDLAIYANMVLRIRDSGGWPDSLGTE